MLNPLKLSSIISLLLMSSTTLYADADNKIEHAIEYRQGAFHVIGWHFGPMGAMVKGEMPFDAQKFAENAKWVQIVSEMPTLEGFVPGSDQGDTEAKAEIWQNWDDFKAKMEKFQEEAAKLAKVAQDASQVDDVKEQLMATGEACKSCHDDYKKD
ncbi:MAG: cytochrome c [Pseudomonadota bacterium]|nr:cytochrome c [Pseudomonadota bacterium]